MGRFLLGGLAGLLTAATLLRRRRTDRRRGRRNAATLLLFFSEERVNDTRGKPSELLLCRHEERADEKN